MAEVPALIDEIKQEPEDILNSHEDIKEDIPEFPEDDKAAIQQSLIPFEDPEVENVPFFSDIEISNTTKCLENVRIVIKDFETQLDWHLKQYMMLRNMIQPRPPKDPNAPPAEGGEEDDDDLISIAQLSHMLMTHPDCNHKFLKRRQPMANGTTGGKRRRANADNSEEEDDPDEMSSEEEDEDDMDSEEEDGYYEDAADEEKYGKNNYEEYEDEEDEEEDEEDEEGGKKKKKKTPAKKKVKTEPNEEIDEEYNELPEVKDENDDEDESMDSFVEPPPAKGKGKGKGKATPAKTPAKATPAKKTPAKKGGGRGRKRKGASDDDDEEEFTPQPKKTPAKRAPRGKKAPPSATITSAQAGEDEGEGEIKSEIKVEEDEVMRDFQSEKDRLNLLFEPMLIHSLVDFKAAIAATAKKPLLVLNDESVKAFNTAADTKKNNVIITFKQIGELPDFVYDNKSIINAVTNGAIKVVHMDVFIEHMSKN